MHIFVKPALQSLIEQVAVCVPINHCLCSWNHCCTTNWFLLEETPKLTVKLPHTTDIAPGPPQRWSKHCSPGVSQPVERLLGAPKKNNNTICCLLLRNHRLQCWDKYVCSFPSINHHDKHKCKHRILRNMYKKTTILLDMLAWY